MTDITLAAAQTIVTAALAHARAKGMKPLGVVVLDTRGAPRALATEDDTSLKRSAVAEAKAHGALAMGMGSRSLAKRAREMPHFIGSVTDVVGGKLVPVPGGVLIRDQAGALLGAVGISGDTSDNDEEAALAGIQAAGLVGDPGQD